MNWIEDLFQVEKPLIGVVHLLPLPGSPRYGGSMDEILEAARWSASALREAGFDGIMFENFGDIPFHPDRVEPHVVGIVSVLVSEFSRHGPCGVNLLRNAARQAVAAAFAGGGSFVRVNVHTGSQVTDQGLIHGRAYDTVRYAKLLGSGIRILADIEVKHAEPLVRRGPLAELQDAVERGLADAVIVTGNRTGEPADLDLVARLKQAAPRTPIFVGSGVTTETVAATLEVADGVIVSTSLEKDPGRIDGVKAHAFVREARR